MPTIPPANSADILLWTTASDGSEGGPRPPTYPGDAGFDLFVSQDTKLIPRKTAIVPCGCRVALPPGYSSFVMTRSSTVLRGILVFQTLIDNGYRGDVFIYAFNLNNYELIAEQGERLAQLVPFLGSAWHMGLEKVDPSKLPPSLRGDKGFGSSGK